MIWKGFLCENIASMDKIKVAMIANDLNINGISTVIMNYCKQLNKEKFLVKVMAGKDINATYVSKCQKYGIELIALPNRKTNTINYYTALYKELKENKVDIVHIHGNSATITPELFIAWRCGVGVRIAHCHNSTCTNIKIHKLFYPFFSMLYTKGIACSPLAGNWLFHKKKYSIINNGFYTQNYIFNGNDCKLVRNRLHIKETDYVIGHVGRFNKQKNQRFLLEIFEEIVKIKPNSWLLLVGNGPDFDEICLDIQKHPNKDRIIIYGETNEIAKLYSAMDVFVFPSLYEGLGIVALEAQINGLPCIISDVVPRDIVVGENVNFVSLKDDMKCWVELITKFTVDINQRKSFYELNINKIEKFNIEKCVMKLEQIYTNEFLLNK